MSQGSSLDQVSHTMSINFLPTNHNQREYILNPPRQANNPRPQITRSPAIGQIPTKVSQSSLRQQPHLQDNPPARLSTVFHCSSPHLDIDVASSQIRDAIQSNHYNRQGKTQQKRQRQARSSRQPPALGLWAGCGMRYHHARRDQVLLGSV